MNGVIIDLAAERKRAPLPLGQKVAYSDMANPYQVAVIVEESMDKYSTGQRCIFVEDYHRSDVTRGAIEGPGGWKLVDEIATAEEIEELKIKAAERMEARQAEQKQAAEKRQTVEDVGKSVIEKKRPAWAKAVIVAYQEIDNSDIMTDYFNTKEGQIHIIAWSKHTRDLFPEMRKAAAACDLEEVKHLGPGKGDFFPVVVFSEDFQADGRHHFKGGRSHWHDDLLPGEHFQTTEEAQSWTEARGIPEPIDFDKILRRFEWKIEETKTEHREKYSMGAGYYLKVGSRYGDGWKIEKWGLDKWRMNNIHTAAGTPGGYRIPEKTTKKTATRTPAATVEDVTVTENEDRDGVEIRFPGKPGEDVRTDLKTHGWRWSRFSSCWYHKRTPEALEYAAGLAAKG